MFKNLSVITFLFILLLSGINGQDKKFTDTFNTDSCTFSHTGRNLYFILEPGYQLVLEGIDNGDTERVKITVLNETKTVNGVETRVVEEHESVNGKVIEISKNYFAICGQTKDIFYFGEDVDIYKNGKVVSHSGAWLAEGNNRAGIIMPGKYVTGDKYYQEIAPGTAMDRAEIISINEPLKTPAGNFSNCLKTEETTPLGPKEKEYKYYAPDIGLIKEESLLLVKYGFVK